MCNFAHDWFVQIGEQPLWINSHNQLIVNSLQDFSENSSWALAF